MAPDKLVLDPLRGAIASLEKALVLPKDDIVRDATIQRFGFTYELCWKFMKRYLETAHGRTDADTLAKKDLFRAAAEVGLVAEPEAWFRFHRARNATSHTYNAQRAEEVYVQAALCLPAAKALLAELERRQE
jgi:nucleotidyltransferase substrate binding protein (TIGR01987 family)